MIAEACRRWETLRDHEAAPAASGFAGGGVAACGAGYLGVVADDQAAHAVRQQCPGLGRHVAVGDQGVDLLQVGERAEADDSPLRVVGDDHDPAGGADEHPVGLGFGQVGRGQPGDRVDPVAAEEEQVEVERPDGQVGDRADQRVGGGAHAAGQDHRGKVGAAAAGRAVVLEEVRHPDGVRHDREPRDLAELTGQLERGRPGGQGDRGPRRDQRRGGPRNRFLLGALQHGLGLEPGLVAARHARQDRAAVHLLDQPGPGENLEIAADGHVGDAEPLGEVADPGTAGPPDVLQDQRLPVLGEHSWSSACGAAAGPARAAAPAGPGLPGPARTVPVQSGGARRGGRCRGRNVLVGAPAASGRLAT